jgi:hypothetical protein
MVQCEAKIDLSSNASPCQFFRLNLQDYLSGVAILAYHQAAVPDICQKKRKHQNTLWQ